MKEYIAQIGQSVIDICMNTYGTLDYLSKLMSDNSIDDVNISPLSQQVFFWDNLAQDDFEIIQNIYTYSTEKIEITVSSNKEFSLEFSFEYN
jgi:hypothetical protein